VDSFFRSLLSSGWTLIPHVSLCHSVRRVCAYVIFVRAAAERARGDSNPNFGLTLTLTLARQVAEGEETQSAMMVIDTTGCEMGENKDEAGSTFNEGEALVVQAHVERLLAAGLPQAAVAVITPYNAQVSERERERPR
jgi:hypothetical protein